MMTITEAVEHLKTYLTCIAFIAFLYVVYQLRRKILKCIFDDDTINTDALDAIYFSCCTCCGHQDPVGCGRCIAECCGIYPEAIHIGDITVGEVPEAVSGSSVYLKISQGTTRHLVHTEEAVVGKSHSVDFSATLALLVRSHSHCKDVEITLCKYNAILGTTEIASVVIPPAVLHYWAGAPWSSPTPELCGRERGPEEVRVAMALKRKFALSKYQPWVYMRLSHRADKLTPRGDPGEVEHSLMCSSWFGSGLRSSGSRRDQAMKTPTIQASVGRLRQPHHPDHNHPRRPYTWHYQGMCVLVVFTILFWSVRMCNVVCHEEFQKRIILEQYRKQVVNSSFVSDGDIMRHCDKWSSSWMNALNSERDDGWKTKHEACTANESMVNSTCQDLTQKAHWNAFGILIFDNFTEAQASKESLTSPIPALFYGIRCGCANYMPPSFPLPWLELGLPYRSFWWTATIFLGFRSIFMYYEWWCVVKEWKPEETDEAAPKGNGYTLVNEGHLSNQRPSARNAHIFFPSDSGSAP